MVGSIILTIVVTLVLGSILALDILGNGLSPIGFVSAFFLLFFYVVIWLT